MAINKVVNKPTTSHAALRAVLNYVTQDKKVKEGYIEYVGPAFDGELTTKRIYKQWIEEKDFWNKNSGRLYRHDIISFHKDEKNITPQIVLEIGKRVAEFLYSGFQSLICVHQDKDHLHCHIVTNTVSYIDGRKLHITKNDLQKQKDYTNNLCKEYGLSVAEKGKHFDGTKIEETDKTIWDQNKYQLLNNKHEDSYLYDCAKSILKSLEESFCKEDFIENMEECGWSVIWQDQRKHIVFQNKEGRKVRDANIEKTFGIKATKEALLNGFERNNANGNRRRKKKETGRYFDESERFTLEETIFNEELARENQEFGRNEFQIGI